MPVLLAFLVPLAVLLIGAVVFDLRRRRRLGTLSSHGISSAVRSAGADAETRTAGPLIGKPDDSH